MHRVVQETSFQGYVIPRDTALMANLYHIMRDPQYWQYPEQFYPEHFLNSDGTFKSDDAAIAFSVGKRSCLGETLARMEFYLFASRLIHQFHFELPLDQTAHNLEPNIGAIRGPKPYYVIITRRF